MRPTKLLALAPIAILAAACSSAGATDNEPVDVPTGEPTLSPQDRPVQELAPKNIHPTRDAKPSNGARPTQGISYHGGPIIAGTTNVYLIWYGNWANNSATTILTDLVSNIGGSSYFNINTTYYNGAGVHVSNSVHYAGSTTDAYSAGTSLSDAQIGGVVSSAINGGALGPADA